MPASIRLAVIILVAACASGCITAITSIKLRPDGSGTIEQSLSMSAAAAAQLATLAKGFGGEDKGKSQASAEPEFFSEAEMKSAATKFGSGVTFVSSTPIKTADRVGRVATYAFTDITKLRIDQKPQTGDLPAPTESGAEDLLFRFSKSPAGTSTLTVVFPEAKLEEARKEAAEKQGRATPTVDPAQLAMMKTLFEGLRVEIGVDVLGTIVKTNSPYVTGSRVTLLEMNFAELLTNDALLASVAQPKSIEEAKRLLKDVKGFKVNLDREVTIEFR